MTISEARKGESAAAEQGRHLRQRAEERLRITGAAMRRMAPVEVRRLVYELQVTQVDLQLQNEELQQAYAELAAARDRYSDLYDFAPVGYLTLTPAGVILEANLEAARLLETERARLIGSLLSRVFRKMEARDTLARYLSRLKAASGSCICDLAVPRADGSRLWLQLESVAVRDARGVTTQYRMVLSNISARKEAEQLQRQLARQLLAVQEHERRHLARELHDEVMQTLTALQMNLDLLADDQPALPESLKSSMALVDDLMDQVRTLSLELRPTVLDELGLAAALEWYCRQQAPRLGLQVHYKHEPVLPRPSPAVETACFRVVQEAVTNIAKHAQAQKVWITLRQHAGELHLTVRDEGVGFNVEASRKGAMAGAGLGLQGMEERMGLIGGRLDIRSASRRGTEIHAWAPLSPVVEG